jgi:GNAT superfamily N-acetyltransferase
MLWRARATLDDRPGALAALAEGCGRVGANILALQVFPVADGGVVDEVVLDAPDDWDADRVGDLLGRAGGREVRVTGCTVHVLQDEPTRYLRAATRLLDEPDRLVPYVADLLGCDTDGWTPDGGTPLTRAWAPLTDTEHGRAAALAGLVRRARERAGDGGPSGEPPASHPVVRLGRVEDAAAACRMHRRCSAESVVRRYGAPLAELRPRAARRMLVPPEGCALVAAAGDEVVAVATLTPDRRGGTAHLSVLVEDAWQHRGLGAALVHRASLVAAAGGAARLASSVSLASSGTLVSETANPVLATYARAGLRAWVRARDGRVEVSASLGRVEAGTGSAHTDVDRDRLRVVSRPYAHDGADEGGRASVLQFAEPGVSSATEGSPDG